MGGPVILADMTSAAVAEACRDRSLTAVLPVGSVEQHAGHLPVGTDAVLAAAVAGAVEARRPATVLLLPPLWFGASDHHEGFAGTVSIGTPLTASVTAAVLAGLHRSTGLARALVVNGHGGNVPAVRTVVEVLARDHPGLAVLAASYWDAMFDDLARRGQPVGTMGHADRHETSLMMAVRPDLAVAPGKADALTDGLPPWAWTGAGFHTRTRAGGVGDPAGASPAEGREFLAAAADGLCRVLDLPW